MPRTSSMMRRIQVETGQAVRAGRLHDVAIQAGELLDDIMMSASSQSTQSFVAEQITEDGCAPAPGSRRRGRLRLLAELDRQAVAEANAGSRRRFRHGGCSQAGDRDRKEALR